MIFLSYDYYECFTFLSYFCKISISKKSGFNLYFENRARFDQNYYEVKSSQLQSMILSVLETSEPPLKVLIVSEMEQLPPPPCMSQNKYKYLHFYAIEAWRYWLAQMIRHDLGDHLIKQKPIFWLNNAIFGCGKRL